MLGPLKNKLSQLMQGAGAAAQRKPGDIFHRGACRVSRQEAVHKLHQLQQSIGDWEGKELVRAFYLAILLLVVSWFVVNCHVKINCSRFGTPPS